MSLTSNFVFLFLCVSLIYAELDLNNRIIGGVPATINSLPYQVSLRYSKKHFCGGSVIDRSYILTAAHCLENKKIKSITIRAGSHFRNKDGVIFQVCSVIIHEQYEGEKTDFDYDIAILQLCKRLPFSQKLLPIALPSVNEIINNGIPAVASGWGSNDRGEYPIQLQKVFLVILSQALCVQKYKNVSSVTSRMLCAGCQTGLCDSCDGDSGGPLVANGKLVGIVSWGMECALKDYPGVYTRVAQFRQWIKTKTKI